MYNWITLLYVRNYHNTVHQLFFNKTLKMKKIPEMFICNTKYKRCGLKNNNWIITNVSIPLIGQTVTPALSLCVFFYVLPSFSRDNYSLDIWVKQLYAFLHSFIPVYLFLNIYPLVCVLWLLLSVESNGYLENFYILFSIFLNNWLLIFPHLFINFSTVNNLGFNSFCHRKQYCFQYSYIYVLQCKVSNLAYKVYTCRNP